MKRKRKNYTPEKKVAILKRQLLLAQSISFKGRCSILEKFLCQHVDFDFDFQKDLDQRQIIELATLDFARLKQG